ncbi:hypothetical protein RCO27_11955 [Sphingosinicella sp. LHD-64]|uniref:hypothetical protein n=1 Tax=Sphingosinicella sp. LHD-64 TaxID=3072139 RepID=UPI00280DAF65|nr:hypothetical protein [Sphingosinicella sp. LHD-64]MDQ8756941.1 hypothetical protein [Sphingosinicella sp. LHD-64]
MATEPIAPAQPNDRGATLINLARGAKVLALLFFFLPWVTVSCAGQELASMSGYELATGSVSVTNPMTGQRETPPGAGERDLPVIAAAALIALALVASFLLARGFGALVAAGGAAAAAALVAYTVFHRIPGKLHQGPTPAGDAADAGINQQQIAEMIRIEQAIGFWLVLAALIAAVAFNLMARSRTP